MIVPHTSHVLTSEYWLHLSIVGVDPVWSGNPPTSVDLCSPSVGNCRGNSVPTTGVFSSLLRVVVRCRSTVCGCHRRPYLFPWRVGKYGTGSKKGRVHIFFRFLFHPKRGSFGFSVFIPFQKWVLRIFGSYSIPKVGPSDFRFLFRPKSGSLGKKIGIHNELWHLQFST